MTATKSEQQISQLEAEIASRNADIQNLAEALATMVAGKPRPQNPSTDNAFTLLKEMVGSAPQQLEQQQIYDEKVRAARTALQLATEICQQKTTELKALHQERRSQQAEQRIQELIAKASQFNVAIDEAFNLLAEMKSLNGQISQLRGNSVSVLRTSADLNEAPYCQISGESVSLRRRFDVKRGG